MSEQNTFSSPLYDLIPKRAILKNHAPLICLVFYLFLDFENDEHRIEQINQLFSYFHDPELYGQLEKSLKEDKEGYVLYEQAQKALSNGEIEGYTEDPDPSPSPPKPNEWPEAYTVSFVIWAESTGMRLSDDIIKDIKPLISSYQFDKSYRDGQNASFPKINQDTLKNLMKEPLWQLPNAIAYVLGYEAKLNTEKNFIFIKSKKTGQKVIEYVIDAYKAHNLEFIDYNTDKEEKDCSLQECKVRPMEFIDWAKTLPLYLNGLENTKQPQSRKPLNDRERRGYQKIIGALVGLTLGEDSNGKPYSKFRTQQSIIDAIHGNYGEKEGLSKRQLEAKFAEGKKALNDPS
ncbi:MAG: hypothetical protein GW903_05280 [Alphaproteobacteria bacterium]|nr:hypothetical protein [Alphaproteobacteria bacterium]NCQ88999.1 hypothetical protein [Alphaproteobacteria bacterium]NCT07900.1 hypothetical protein [Alphaproteobacteria bacterium]